MAEKVKDRIPEEATLRQGWDSKYLGHLTSLKPFTMQLRIYKTMREALPFLDTAIRLLTLLVGWIDLDEERTEPSTYDFLDEWQKTVPLGNLAQGFHRWSAQMVDQALEFGFSAGELEPKPELVGTSRLTIADSETIGFVKVAEGQVAIAQRKGAGMLQPLNADAWIELVAPDLRKGHPHGYPLAFACPKAAEILVRLMENLNSNTWRFGNPRFHGHVQGKENTPEKVLRERKDEVRQEFEKILLGEKSGQAGDLWTYSNSGEKGISIETWGLVKESLQVTDAWRTMAEQLIGATGLPGWMLGVHWSTTERLSSRQSDLLTANVKRIRDYLDPTIRRMFRRALILEGKAGAAFGYTWRRVSLQDAVEEARAEMYRAHAERARMEAAAKAKELGLSDKEVEAIAAGRKTLARAVQAPAVDTRTDAVNGGRAVFEGHEHRNPRINALRSEMTRAMVEVRKKYEARLLLLCALPPLAEVENWTPEDTRTVGAREAPALPDKADFDKVFEDWYRELTGTGLSPAEVMDAAYPGYSGRAIAAGASQTHEELAATVAPGQKLKPGAVPTGSSPEVKAFVQRGQKLIKAKITVDFQDMSWDILKAGIGEGKSGYQIAYEIHNAAGEGADWHWDRLARSETAMADDLGGYMEAREQDANYAEWVAAPGACEICAALDGQVWKIGENPRPVSDTHPNCCCSIRYLWIYDGETAPAQAQEQPYALAT